MRANRRFTPLAALVFAALVIVALGAVAHVGRRHTPLGAGPSSTLTLLSPAAYPYPPPAPSAYPYPPPSPVPLARLHDEVAGLPDGARQDRGSAWLIGHGYAPTMLHAIPITTTDGRLDLAVVTSDHRESRVTWLLRRDGGLSLSPTRIRYQDVSGREGGGLTTGALVDTPDVSGLLVLVLPGGQGGGGVVVPAWLPLEAAEAVPSKSSYTVSFVSWTGGDQSDAVLELPGGDVALLYTTAGLPGAYRRVTRVESPAQVVDVDGDRRYEIVTPSGSEWLVQHWNGAAFAEAPPMSGVGPSPSTVGDGDLPSLPADLYFLRHHEIWRWPRQGGSLQRMMADPEAGAVNDARTPRPGLATFRLSSRSGRIAYPLTDVLESVDGDTVQTTTLYVYDPSTGATARFAPEVSPGEPQDPEYIFHPYYDISADGATVVYLGPSREPDTYQSGVYVASVADPVHATAVGDCGRLAPESTRDCRGLQLSPDGQRLAYGDSSGVWVVDLPAGGSPSPGGRPPSARLVASDHFRARLWSPDGRYLVIAYDTEGGSAYDVVEVPDSGPGGTVHDLALFEDAWPLDLAWLPGGSDVLVASGGATPVSVVSGTASHPDVPLAVPLMARLWPFEYADGDPLAFGPSALPGGDLGFAVRDSSAIPYPGNAVFRAHPDGSGLSPIVALPPGYTSAAEDFGQGLAGEMRWSPGGQAFAFIACEPGNPSFVPSIVGLADGSGSWDVRELLAGATGLAWSAEQP